MLSLPDALDSVTTTTTTTGPRKATHSIVLTGDLNQLTLGAHRISIRPLNEGTQHIRALAAETNVRESTLAYDTGTGATDRVPGV